MSEKIRNFKDLKIWQNSMELVTDIYSCTRTFPSDEKYGLISQIRRASVSIPSNIAEGFSRLHKKEYTRFLYIALGSCSEVETQVEISKRLNFISDEAKDALITKLTYITRMIQRLIHKVISSTDRLPMTDDRRLTTDDKRLTTAD